MIVLFLYLNYKNKAKNKLIIKIISLKIINYIWIISRRIKELEIKDNSDKNN